MFKVTDSGKSIALKRLKNRGKGRGACPRAPSKPATDCMHLLSQNTLILPLFVKTLKCLNIQQSLLPSPPQVREQLRLLRPVDGRLRPGGQSLREPLYLRDARVPWLRHLRAHLGPDRTPRPPGGTHDHWRIGVPRHVSRPTG